MDFDVIARILVSSKSVIYEDGPPLVSTARRELKALKKIFS